MLETSAPTIHRSAARSHAPLSRRRGSKSSSGLSCTPRTGLTTNSGVVWTGRAHIGGRIGGSQEVFGTNEPGGIPNCGRFGLDLAVPRR